MQTKNFWVGDRPAGAWVFQVLDEKTGVAQNLTGFTSASVLFLDPQNKPVDIPSANVIITDSANGKVTFLWPDVSLFTMPGRYVMQLQLDNATTSRKTTVQEILVKKLGGVTN